MTIMSTAVGVSLLAHGLHYTLVLAGLWGLAALLLPHALDRGSRPGRSAPPLRTEHDLRVAALRASVVSGTLTTHTPTADRSPAPVPSPRRPAHPLGLPLALVASAAAAGVHAAVAPPHLLESTLFGALLPPRRLRPGRLGRPLVLHPTERLIRLGIVLHTGLIALWLVTRLSGLPFGLLPEPHPLGAWDLVCVVWEACAVSACLYALGRPVPCPTRPAWFDWHPSSRAAAVGPAATTLVLLTLSGAHS